MQPPGVVGEGLVQVGLHGRFNLALVHQQRLNPVRLQPLVGRPPHAARQQYLAVGHHGQLLLKVMAVAVAVAVAMAIAMGKVFRGIVMELDVGVALRAIVRVAMLMFMMVMIMLMTMVGVARFIAQLATHKHAVDQFEYGAVTGAPEVSADGFIIVGNHPDFHIVLQN